MRIKIYFLFFISLIFNDLSAQKPKNIIFLIGDGMGYNQMKVCEYYYQMQHIFSRWTNYWVSTYNADGFYNSDSTYNNFSYVRKRFTDSAPAATALATGYKAQDGVIGLNENFYRVKNLTEAAKQIGKKAGVVTSVPFCHATPAGFVAHTENRDNYHQIASQMFIESKIDVIIGCGHPDFDNDAKKFTDSSHFEYIYPSIWRELQKNNTELTDYLGKKRKIQSCDGDNIPDAWYFCQETSEFFDVAEGKKTYKRFFGIPKVYETLQLGRNPNKKSNSEVPPLSILAKSALNILSKNNSQGFFLMIEGGAIDWACHNGMKDRLIEEVKSFSETVETVVQWVEQNGGWEENLVIITADHETGYLTDISMNESVYNADSLKNFHILDVKNEGKNTINRMQFLQVHRLKSYVYNHTNQLVKLFVKGAGSEMFEKKLNEYSEMQLNFDKLRRSYYIDNTDIPKILFDFLK